MTSRGSRPLHELADHAPDISPILQLDMVLSAYSNDDSLSSFERAMGRIDTSEYQQTANPVAVLIGESALAANIDLIPEPTIVLLDYSAPMVQHMTEYTKQLREANGPSQWRANMGLADNSSLGDIARRHQIDRLADQVTWWELQREPHPLQSEPYFGRAQELARQKAIIPWQGDITDSASMQNLGDALRMHNATVTLLNLTNVIPYSVAKGERYFSDAAGYADQLENLPTTPTLPILTTGRKRIRPDRNIVEATGPFFGLGHLRSDGGSSSDGPVAVSTQTQTTSEQSQQAYSGFAVYSLETDASGMPCLDAVLDYLRAQIAEAKQRFFDENS